MMKTTGVYFTSSLRFSFGVLLFTERFQIGDNGFAEVRNVRIITQLRLRFAPEIFDTARSISTTKLAEVRSAITAAYLGIPPPAAAAGAASARLIASFTCFRTFAQNTASLRPVPSSPLTPKLARQTANQRGSVNVSVVFSELRFAFRFAAGAAGFSCRRSRRRRFLFSRSTQALRLLPKP